MVKKTSDLSDGPVVVKMKSQREDCPPQTLRVALVNGKVHINVTNIGQGELHLHRGQNIRVVDLRSAGYFHITRDAIQRCLHERFIFLNGKESQDYVSCIQLMMLMTRTTKYSSVGRAVDCHLTGPEFNTYSQLNLAGC